MMGNISEDAARRGTLNLARELALDVAPNTFPARADPKQTAVVYSPPNTKGHSG
jgi:hypothetical protein